MEKSIHLVYQMYRNLHYIINTNLDAFEKRYIYPLKIAKRLLPAHLTNTHMPKKRSHLSPAFQPHLA